MSEVELTHRTPREQLSYWYWKIVQGECTPQQFLIAMELLLLDLGVPREVIEQRPKNPPRL